MDPIQLNVNREIIRATLAKDESVPISEMLLPLEKLTQWYWMIDEDDEVYNFESQTDLLKFVTKTIVDVEKWASEPIAEVFHEMYTFSDPTRKLLESEFDKLVEPCEPTELSDS